MVYGKASLRYSTRIARRTLEWRSRLQRYDDKEKIAASARGTARGIWSDEESHNDHLLEAYLGWVLVFADRSIQQRRPAPRIDS